jgi:hypothetical protein
VPPSSLVDARELAAILNVDRSFVYRHAHELGARRLGAKRGRLRFDVSQARASLEQSRRGASSSALPPRRRKRTPAAPIVGSILRVRA